MKVQNYGLHRWENVMALVQETVQIFPPPAPLNVEVEIPKKKACTFSFDRKNNGVNLQELTELETLFLPLGPDDVPQMRYVVDSSAQMNWDAQAETYPLWAKDVPKLEDVTYTSLTPLVLFAAGPSLMKTLEKYFQLRSLIRRNVLIFGTEEANLFEDNPLRFEGLRKNFVIYQEQKIYEECGKVSGFWD